MPLFVLYAFLLHATFRDCAFLLHVTLGRITRAFRPGRADAFYFMRCPVRLVRPTHFVSCGGKRELLAPYRVDAFYFMGRYLLRFKLNWPPRGTRPAKA